MKRLQTYGPIVAIVVLVAGAVLYAEEARQFNQPVEVNKGRLYLGASVAFVMEGTTNDAFEMQFVVDPTEDTFYTWPATNGSAGTQLQTTADGVLSWAAAGSSRDVKTLDGYLKPQDALNAILKAPIHTFRYKPGAKGTTGDYTTEYAGILADEAPWAMHHDGQVLNPVNALGYTAAAIQAQERHIRALEAQVRALARRQP